MGIDFKSLLNTAKAAIRSVASMQEKSEKVDTDPESETLKVLLSGVNKSAATGLDTVEFNKLVAEEKSSLVPFVDDAEILSGLMSALSEVNPSINMEKIEKYNKVHPVLAEENIAETITTSKDGYIGLDTDSFRVIEEALGENAGQVFRYMSAAIESGSASRISNNQVAFQYDIEGAERVTEAIRNFV